MQGLWQGKKNLNHREEVKVFSPCFCEFPYVHRHRSITNIQWMDYLWYGHTLHSNKFSEGS